MRIEKELRWMKTYTQKGSRADEQRETMKAELTDGALAVPLPMAFPTEDDPLGKVSAY